MENCKPMEFKGIKFMSLNESKTMEMYVVESDTNRDSVSKFLEEARTTGHAVALRFNHNIFLCENGELVDFRGKKPDEQKDIIEELITAEYAKRDETKYEVETSQGLKKVISNIEDICKAQIKILNEIYELDKVENIK